MEYEIKEAYEFVANSPIGPDDPLTYALEVRYEGALQFRLRVDATPALVLGNAPLGDSGYDQYDLVKEAFQRLARNLVDGKLVGWQPGESGSRVQYILAKLTQDTAE